MSQKSLKVLTYTFWAGVAGVVLTFAGSLYTAISQHKAEQATQAPVIVTPAIVPHQ